MTEKCGFFDIDGSQLDYQLLTPGADDAPTLVFLHEGLGCIATWKLFPHRVAAATGCRALIYSRAGYGRSTPVKIPRPITFMHDEGLVILPKILDHAGIKRAVLIGHSDGASIALINAGGVIDPRIQALVLMAPHVFVEDLALASIHRARDAYTTTDLRRRLARYHGDNVDCAFLGWSQTWLDPDFMTWNIESYLPQIEVPVLLIQGEEDEYGTTLQLETIRTKLPRGAELTLLANCGHSPFRDQPEETLRAVECFIRNSLKILIQPGSV